MINRTLLALLLVLTLLPACHSSSSSGEDDDMDTDTGTDSVCDGCGNGCDNGDKIDDGNPGVINSAEDIADFDGYTAFSGELIITDLGLPDLTGLECLTEAFMVTIYDNPTLERLEGLGCLESIELHLEIYANDSLQSLHGLDCLRSVEGTIHIGAFVEDWQPSENVGNPALTSLAGLESMESINRLRIRANDSLANLSGLEKVTSIDSFRILNNPSLTSLDGLTSLESIGSELAIYNNPALPDCEVCDLLDQLTSEPFAIEIHNNLSDSCTPAPENCP